jgi:hypothetical protein
MTTMSHGDGGTSSALAATNSYDAMTTRVASVEGARDAPRFSSLAARVSSTRARTENFSRRARFATAGAGRGDDQQHPATTLRPALRDAETGLDGLPEAHLVGQQHPARDGRLQREERGVDLVGVEIDAGVADGAGDPVDIGASCARSSRSCCACQRA